MKMGMLPNYTEGLASRDCVVSRLSPRNESSDESDDVL